MVELYGSSRTTRAVELAAQFAEQRQRVLAENIANLETPDYRARRLDAEVFQDSLQQALDKARDDGAHRLELRGSPQVSTGAAGNLNVTPVEEPAENVLFHDGTSANLEKLMTDAAENAATYELATNLLRTRYEMLLKAIRGRS